MKFGHDLVKVIGVSDPEWAPFFMQYKTLKKYIKLIRGTGEKGEASEGGEALDTAQLEAMKSSGAEVTFFRALRTELKKSSTFFQSAEHMLEIRRERIAEALKHLRAGIEPPKGQVAALLDDSDEKALAACVTYYRDLLLLENYAIINYCGFSKILKKHDKLTGFKTRAQFMRVCVAPQPFTHYPRLLEMIKEAEDLYHDIRSFSPAKKGPALAASSVKPGDGAAGDEVHTVAADAKVNNPSWEQHSTMHARQRLSRDAMPSEETDFIDAILNLRKQAVRLRQAEDSPEAPDDERSSKRARTGAEAPQATALPTPG